MYQNLISITRVFNEFFAVSFALRFCRCFRLISNKLDNAIITIESIRTGSSGIPSGNLIRKCKVARKMRFFPREINIPLYISPSESEAKDDGGMDTGAFEQTVQ